MKMKTLLGSLLAFGLGISTVTAFAFTDYYPPERINCTLEKNKLVCYDFNREYLAEDTFNSDFNKGDETFHFGTAVAYFTQNQAEASVFFTYRNSDNKMVKLKTVNTSIKPSMTKGAWKKLTDDIYTCDAGYMSCPITNLPSRS